MRKRNCFRVAHGLELFKYYSRSVPSNTFKNSEIYVQESSKTECKSRKRIMRISKHINWGVKNLDICGINIFLSKNTTDDVLSA